MSKSEETRDLSHLVDTVIRLGLVGILLYCSYLILSPFIIPVVWGAILAVACYPGYVLLSEKLGGKKKTAAALVCLLLLLIILLPSVYLGESVVSGVTTVKASWESGEIEIPTPSTNIKSWPLVGEPLYHTWAVAHRNLAEAIKPLASHMKTLGGNLLSGLAGAGFALLQFIFSIFVAGFLLAGSERLAAACNSFSRRVAKERGPSLLKDSELTVRSVARGIIGVAVIQSVLAGAGLALAGVPGAGFWALACLLLGIIQIGVGPVLLIATVYLYTASDPVTASIFLVWALFVGLLDNVLKPILLGKGAPVPMLVIFLGALGGFLRTGIIGLFVGAVVLSVTYKLFEDWVYTETS